MNVSQRAVSGRQIEHRSQIHERLVLSVEGAFEQCSEIIEELVLLINEAELCCAHNDEIDIVDEVGLLDNWSARRKLFSTKVVNQPELESD